MMYVIMTIVGPYVMKDRPPVNIRVTMLVYNFVMIILSYYMFHEVCTAYNILYASAHNSYNTYSCRGVAKVGAGRAQAQPISFSALPTQFAKTIQARSKYPNRAVTLIQESSIISMIINDQLLKLL